MAKANAKDIINNFRWLKINVEFIGPFAVKTGRKGWVMFNSFTSLLATLLFVVVSCSSGDFAGEGGAGIRPTSKKTPVTPTNPQPSDEPSNGPNELIIDDAGIISPLPDYTSCLQLPKSGKRGYGQCGANEVVVIVNDGGAREMTCCPLASPIILSQKADERYITRSGRCQSNEVLTGMVSEQGTGYCTKINTSLVKLTTPVPSIYVTGQFPGVMGEIARSYNISDTCICPEGTVAIGGHTPQDNTCNEQCVKIEKK